MDFSGDKGRVVVKASEALGIAYEQTHKLRVNFIQISQILSKCYNYISLSIWVEFNIVTSCYIDIFNAFKFLLLVWMS